MIKEIKKGKLTQKKKYIDSCFKVKHVHVFTLTGLIMKENHWSLLL